jgi:two-component system sensor histidine kinase RegB
MTVFPPFLEDQSLRHRLRLQTLTRLRWLAVAGQSLAVVVIAHGYGFAFPEALCFALIACSAWLNIFLSVRFPAAHRLPPLGAMAVLSFDVLQLSGLLFMTGGLANPVFCSALRPGDHFLGVSAGAPHGGPWRPVSGGGDTACLLLAAAALVSDSDFEVPFLLIVGAWIAIVSTTVFAAVYAYQVSAEATQLADALVATELVLQREQHISALDGLAAAAAHELGTPLATISVVAREMEKALASDPRFADDLMLLRSQSERCRDILRRLTTLSAEGEVHMARLPLGSLIEEIIAPHREFGIAIEVVRDSNDLREPVGRRNPGIIFGLGNLIENAVDFASNQVTVTVSHDAERVSITIDDDGPGFAPDVLTQIGVPFMNRRNRMDREKAGGLGLGLFIAKTLLERSGATLSFSNRSSPDSGAHVQVRWPREKMDLLGANSNETPPVGAG